MSEYTKTKIVTNMVKNAKFSEDSIWSKGAGWTIDTTQFWGIARADTSSVSSISQNISGVTDEQGKNYYRLRYLVDYAFVQNDNDLKLNSSGAFKVRNAQQGQEYDLSASSGLHDFEVECTDAGGLLSLELAANCVIGIMFVQMIPVRDDVYLSIASAVSSLSGAGGTIIVEDGEYLIFYRESPYTSPVPSNCSILGQGKASLYIYVWTDIFKNSNQYTGNERIVISGLTFYSVVGNGDHIYENIPINMKKVKHCVFENLRFVGTSDNPLKVVGLQIEGSGTADDSCVGNIVSGCVFERIRDGNDTSPYNSTQGVGLQLKGYCRQTMVVNNTFTDCYNGMVLDGSPENALSGNVVTESKKYGIWVKLSDFITLQENQVTGGEETGICIDRSNNCAVQGNVCKGNDDYGILVQGGETEGAYNNALCGNVCRENGESGICLGADVKYANVSGNNCYGNTQYGIREENDDSTANNLYVGNMCHDNAAGQMLVSSAANNMAINMCE